VILRYVAETHPDLQEVPADDAPVQDIRRWLHAEESQPALRRITHLNLRGLTLTCVPLEIRLCTGLQQLDLSNNQLASLPKKIFHGLTGLVELNLSDNRLIFLPEDLIEGMRELRRLSFDNNHLTSLPKIFFRGPRGLQLLYLSNNQLTTLPKELFEDWASLQRITLFNNRLTTLPKGLFQRLLELESLRLSGNPQLLYFHQDLPNQNNIGCLRTIDAFFSYACTSPLAQVYQLVAGNASPQAVSGPFSQVPVNIRNAIFRTVWEEAGRQNGDPQWGEHHAWDNMQVFGSALKRYVSESFGNPPEGLDNILSHIDTIMAQQS
jgi:Leucine-rich repeat (LRR) protein